MSVVMKRGPVRPLRTNAQYEAALAEYETYFDAEPKPGSLEGDRFELLGLVIAKYEDAHFPIGDASPRDVIALVMESRAYTQSDLAKLLGSRSRASEILSGSRDLTLDQIRRLHREWGIPADALIGKVTA